MGELERLFAGSAEKAANLDPYQRLQVVLGEISESVGVTLLPLLEKFASWFLSVVPGIQAFFKAITDALDSPPVRKAFGSLEASLAQLGASLAKLFGISTSPQANGFISFFVVLAGVLDGIVKTVDVMVQGFKNAFPVFSNFANLVDTISRGLVSISGYTPPVVPGQVSTPQSSVPTASSKQNVTININKGNVTAKEIANAVNKGTKTTGAPSIPRGAIRTQ
jgi:hypothetical protein